MFLKSILPFFLSLAMCSVPVRSMDHIPGQVLGGSANSPIRIEVFSDFQCPACRELYLGTMRQLLQQYASKDKVCVIYHEYPLSMHQYSREAARYAEAASQLGRQQMLSVYDSLFADQAEWSQDGRLDATVSKVLTREDFEKLKKIMQDSSINATIDKEVQLGMQREVRSTPTLFIYYIGKQQKVEGLVTYLVMKQFIDSVLK
jgi:protein-disulfide isomerase